MLVPLRWKKKRDGCEQAAGRRRVSAVKNKRGEEIKGALR